MSGTKTKAAKATAALTYETVKDLHAQAKTLEQKTYNFKVVEGAPFTCRDVLGVSFARRTRKFDPETKEWTWEPGLTAEAAPELVETIRQRLKECWIRVGVRQLKSGRIKRVRPVGFVDARKDSDKNLAKRLEKDPKARRQFNPMTGTVVSVYYRLDDFLTITELEDGSFNADNALAAENRKLREKLDQIQAGFGE